MRDYRKNWTQHTKRLRYLVQLEAFFMLMDAKEALKKTRSSIWMCGMNSGNLANHWTKLRKQWVMWWHKCAQVRNIKCNAWGGQIVLRHSTRPSVSTPFKSFPLLLDVHPRIVDLWNCCMAGGTNSGKKGTDKSSYSSLTLKEWNCRGCMKGHEEIEGTAALLIWKFKLQTILARLFIVCLFTLSTVPLRHLSANSVTMP